MAQLKENLEFLTPSEHIPVVIILIASGWRISDVLNLRYDTCLEYTEQGWYLKGDIRKTRTIGHRIPISDEVKAVVESVAQIARQKSTETNNPQHLLFNRYSGSRMGMAPDPIPSYKGRRADKQRHEFSTCSEMDGAYVP